MKLLLTSIFGIALFAAAANAEGEKNKDKNKKLRAIQIAASEDRTKSSTPAGSVSTLGWASEPTTDETAGSANGKSPSNSDGE